jgi:hypothetical protein
MKLIITESKYKNILSRYWDKTGGKVDKTFISLFGLDDNNNDINYNQAYKYLIQWRGEKQSKELAKTLLLQNPHHIDDFGGYDFFFEVTDIRNWELNDDGPNVVVKVKVDDLGGSVTLMDGEDKTLEDALDNDDYGWEIESEVDWALNGYFKDNITAQTGIKIIYDTPKYSSRIFNLS